MTAAEHTADTPLQMQGILEQDIMYAPGVGPARKALLVKELDIKTYADMLETYPYRYVDRSRVYKIADMSGEMPFVQVRGQFIAFETYEGSPRSRRAVAHLTDGSGIIDLVWFGRAQQVIKSLDTQTTYIVFGKPTIFGGRYQIAHPEIERDGQTVLSTIGLQPVYHVTERMKKAGITSRSISRITRAVLERIKEPLPETLPQQVMAHLHLVSRDTALRDIHGPIDNDSLNRARFRLKFEELFYVQLNILRYAADRRRRYRGYVFSRVGNRFNTFYANNLPFSLTEAQKRVVREIRADMRSGRQMNRLLQGDVGSGKTLVALMAMLIAADNGYQACIMAPTEILAEQHYATLQSFLGGIDVTVRLLTGNITGRRRTDVLEALSAGNIDILVGTHAVIEETVNFKRLGMAVIDEQHRFGVAQRARLWTKSDNPPHVLVMTATPIPRTLAMTVYGDLDVSVIDELPPGRKPIVTLHKYDTQTVSLYSGIRRQIDAGRQVYIVYPLIKESERSDMKNLEDGYAALHDIFPEYRIGKVHGQMKPADKDAEMQRFARGETDILVATTVIEVGVNVPNASVMVILDAQRFGLSQLHQLRGRVGRGADQAYCLLVTRPQLSDDTRRRIDIMCSTNDGFEIAEADLKLRGPGDLEGTQQSGMAISLKIANIARDAQLVQPARDEARKIVDDDPECNKQEYAPIWRRLDELRKTNVNWGAIS